MLPEVDRRFIVITYITLEVSEVAPNNLPIYHIFRWECWRWLPAILPASTNTWEAQRRLHLLIVHEAFRLFIFSPIHLYALLQTTHKRISKNAQASINKRTKESQQAHTRFFSKVSMGSITFVAEKNWIVRMLLGALLRINCLSPETGLLYSHV